MKKYLPVLLLVFIVSFFLSSFAIGASNNDESLKYLTTHQDEKSGGLLEDGGSQAQALQTSWGAIAFAASGYNPATIKVKYASPNLLSFALDGICDNKSITDIERAVLVASSAGLDPNSISGCSLVNKINNAFDSSTGQIGPDVVSTIFGVLALKSAGKNVSQSTIDYLLAHQLSDGSWDSGWGGESNITGQAIQALILAGVDKNNGNIIKAKTYLKSLQLDSGGVKYDSNDWTTATDAFSDAYTLQAIYALGESPESADWQKNGKTILDDIASLKDGDGYYAFSSLYGKVNPVWTTSIVLMALSQKPLAFIGKDLKDYTQKVINPDPVPPPASSPPIVPAPIINPPVAAGTVAVPTQTSVNVQKYKTFIAPKPQPSQLATNVLPAAVESTTVSVPSEPISLPAVRGQSDTNNKSYNYLYYAIALFVGISLSLVIKRFMEKQNAKSI